MKRASALALLLGLLITIVMMAAQSLGALGPWEWRSADLRFRVVPRSDRMSSEIVHVDIDDGSIVSFGRWPWDRGRLADVIDELHAAGAKTIALDLILSNAQQYPEGSAPTIDHDTVFARSLEPVAPVLAVDIQVKEDLFGDVWQTARGQEVLETLFDRLASNITLKPSELDLADEYLERFKVRQTEFKRATAWRAIRSAEPPFATFEAFERALVPNIDTLGSYSQQDMLRRAWDQFLAWQAVAPQLAGASAGSISDKIPLLAFVKYADGIGFVSVRGQTHPDGSVREIEAQLPVNTGSALQFGLAAALSHRGLSRSDVAIVGDTLTVGDVELPLRDGKLWIDWPASDRGERRWERLLAPRSAPGPGAESAPERAAGHVAIGAFASLAQMRRQHQRNLDKCELLKPAVYPGEAGLATVTDYAKFLLTDPEVEDDIRANCENWLRLAAEVASTAQEIADTEAQLRALVEGKLVFIGWTATGALADFVDTALGAKTPGVIVHAAVADMALTGRHVRFVPLGLGLAFTLLLGFLCTLAAARLSTVPSVIAALAILTIYVVVAGGWLFSAYDLVLPLVAPVIAGASSWIACTALQAAISQRERKRITRQFRARVSAQLVDYLVENPDAVSMSGEERELTVVIGDLAGFTTISEQLGGQRTVATLNRYMIALTDVLIAQGAYMNKFLGDGLMAFWSAFSIDPEQAGKACRAALDCHRVVEQLNDDPQFSEIPRLGLRVGVATGHVVVGDCGAPPDLNDYTVIGDAVNLAARLESANKQFGTRILINGRTRELVGGNSMLMRPIGCIRVVGQERKVDVFEVMPPGTSPQLIEISERVVQTFVAGEFPACLRALDELEAEAGPSKLVDVYRQAIDVVDDGFDGALQLTEK